MKNPHYDLVVLGGGPAGYIAAIRSAQLGMTVACVDQRESLGGTCLNIGCIPSKSLLNSTEKFWEAKDHFPSLGITAPEIQLDLTAMMKHKEKAVTTLTRGINHLFQNHKIDHIQGTGQLQGNQQVGVRTPKETTRTLHADHIVIATGSVPVSLDGVLIDENRICTSEGILGLSEVPKHLIIIGGGYIGLEMGSVWGRLGAKITCVEYMDRIIPTMDHELATQLQKILEDQGFNFRLRTKVTEAKVEQHTVTVTTESTDDHVQEREQIVGSHVLVAVGRRPYTDQLGLHQAGIDVTDKGFVSVDTRFRTSMEGIYAIGDIAGEPLLAHKAQDEAVACVDAIGGKGNGYVNYDTIPSIIYTSPEVASVGKTEEELKKGGTAYRVGRFPFRANSRAWCVGKQQGFVKILSDEHSDLILGSHMIGPDVSTLIHEIVTTMEFGASAEELGHTSHGHPTYNEAVREAALSVHQRSLHI